MIKIISFKHSEIRYNSNVVAYTQKLFYSFIKSSRTHYLLRILLPVNTVANCLYMITMSNDEWSALLVKCPPYLLACPPCPCQHTGGCSHYRSVLQILFIYLYAVNYLYIYTKLLLHLKISFLIIMYQINQLIVYTLYTHLHSVFRATCLLL